MAAVRLHPDAIFAEHVGPIGEEGDAPEALGLTLGAKDFAGSIKTHQSCVGRRVDLDLGLDCRFLAGQRNNQRRTVHPPFRILAVDRDPDRHDPIAVEPQRPVVGPVALDNELGAHSRRLRIEVERQLDVRHEPVGRSVILAPDGDMGGALRSFRIHSDIGHGRVPRQARPAVQCNGGIWGWGIG